MAYTATTWVEGVTTLGPTNMNKIETELASLDSSVTALQTADKTVTIGASSVVSTDTNGGVTIPWGISVASVVSVVVCGGQGWGTPDVMINIDDAVPPTTTGVRPAASDASIAACASVSNSATDASWSSGQIPTRAAGDWLVRIGKPR